MGLVCPPGDRFTVKAGRFEKTCKSLFITGDIIMREQQGFFSLETKLQDRLRYFMASLAIIQLLAFLIPPLPTSFIFLIIGMGINLFILYFSFSVKRAPNFYFRLITWFFWFTIIFDGYELYRVLSGQEIFTLKNIPSILALVVALAIASTISLYRTSINNLKKTEITS
jgi:hypothetical protein